MVEGKTKTGFEFKVADDALDDVELLEELADIQNGDGLKVFDMIERLLGKEQKRAMYDHVRDAKTGKVSFELIAPELDDILTALAETSGESKNS